MTTEKLISGRSHGRIVTSTEHDGPIIDIDAIKAAGNKPHVKPPRIQSVYDETNGNNGWRGILTAFALILMLSCVIIGFIVWYHNNGPGMYSVDGPSMHPTYSTGDILVGDARFTADDVKDEDVVVSNVPEAWSTSADIIVKRVVATSGETITLDKYGRLHRGNSEDSPFVDDREEQYSMPCKAVIASGPLTLHLGKNDLLLRGDNVDNSYDSRHAWCEGESPIVHISQLRMKVEWSIPLGRLSDRIAGRS